MSQEVGKTTFSFPLKPLGVLHILPSGLRLCYETQCSGCPTPLCLCGLCGRIVYMFVQQVAANNMAARQHDQLQVLDSLLCKVTQRIMMLLCLGHYSLLIQISCPVPLAAVQLSFE